MCWPGGRPVFSGADLENLVNEAALQAAKVNKDRVDMADFEHAKDKVLMGKERRSLILSDEEKRTTAYHEGGHALVAKKLPDTDPVHKVSIIPRGMALGITMQLPTDDRHNYSRAFLQNSLAVLMGGRVAEEVVLQQMTTGAGNDIERATGMARKMVCSWGMSEVLGPLSYGERDDEIFLGKDLVHHKNFSEETLAANRRRGPQDRGRGLRPGPRHRREQSRCPGIHRQGLARARNHYRRRDRSTHAGRDPPSSGNAGGQRRHPAERRFPVRSGTDRRRSHAAGRRRFVLGRAAARGRDGERRHDR